MSSSRRKSCLACVRSKRKCDQRFPSCQRCLTKKIDCEFLSRNFNQLWPTTESNENGNGNVASAQAYVEELPSSWQLQRSPALPAVIFPPSMNDAFFNVGNNPFNLPSISSDDFLSSLVIEDIVAQQNLNDIRQIPDAILQARVEFAAKRLAAVPRTFAEQGQTMFVHRVLFQERSPPALQDALSACALYCLKNSENQALVFRNLEHKQQQLISSIDLLLISNTDLLAAVQALLLYQMIRLFDGDIRLRAQAEADEPVLLMWAGSLNSRMRQIMPSLAGSVEAQFLLENRSTNWQRWLIEESSRRTVVTVFMLKGVYDFLKVGYDKAPDLRMSFTAQSALWNAQSELGWQKAHSEREQLEVRVTHWDEAIAKAKPSDLEELGVLIMVMLWGLDATRKWLGQSYISRYGLEGTEYSLS
jgi:hypothetical protein